MADISEDTHVKVFRRSNGTGVEDYCRKIVIHAKATGHGMDDIVAEIAWQWFRHSQESANTQKEEN